MINIPSREATKLSEFAWSIGNVFKALYQSIVASPKRNKRILKVSLTLTMAVAFTLPPTFASFHGTNPFLIGTVVSLRMEHHYIL